ncbi:MAG: MFS transporter [Defluviitaleaceae bacterium]|nr:MFS transporter [Defluviitaleaceae bacterium]
MNKKIQIQAFIYKIQFFTLLASAAILSFQYELFMLDRGVHIALALLVFGIGQTSGLLTSIVIRKYIDIINQSKLFQISLCVRTLTMLIMFFTQNHILFISLFLIYNINSSAGFLFESNVAKWSSENSIRFSTLRMFGSTGFAVAGFLATFLYNLTGSLNFILLFLATLNGLNAFFSFKIPFKKSEKIQSEELIIISAKTRILIILCATISTLPGAFGIILNNTYRYYFGLNVNDALFFASLSVLLGSFVSELVGFKTVDILVKKFNAKKTILIGIVISLIRWIATFFAPNHIFLTATYLTHGFTFAYVYLGILAYIKQKETNKVVMEFFIFSNIISLVLVQLTNLLLEFFTNSSVAIALSIINFVSLILFVFVYIVDGKKQ